jgi:hypothetical protein
MASAACTKGATPTAAPPHAVLTPVTEEQQQPRRSAPPPLPQGGALPPAFRLPAWALDEDLTPGVDMTAFNEDSDHGPSKPSSPIALLGQAFALDV